MTVSELIVALSTLEPDRVVVVSRDEEGNGYQAVRQLDTGMFHEGEFKMEAKDLTPEKIAKGYGEGDVSTEGQKCVCLWP